MTEHHPIGNTLYHFPVLDSTNACALKLLSQFRPKEGTVISADYQTAGRGQFGREWHSAQGLNLCLSCILYPEIKPMDQFRLNMLVALGVRDTVAGYCPDKEVSIKWPNDIYVGDKKIAGILIQNTIKGNHITACVVGIGLNVNETVFPPELPNPTSLHLEHRDTFETGHVRDQLFNHLTRRYKQLDISNDRLMTEYIDSLYRKGQLLDYRIVAKDSIQKGIISNIDESGRLGIVLEDGNTIYCQHGEIEFI